MSTISKILPQPPDSFSTQISTSTVSSSELTIALDSVSGLPTEGVGQLLKKDADGNLVAGSVEFIHWTNVSGSTITLSDTDDRGITGSDSSAQAYVADDYFEVWVSSYYSPYGGLIEHGGDGTHDATKVVSLDGSSNIDSTLTGWITAGETWTYSAWDDTNGVSTATITVPSDATTKYQPGMRVKFTQSTGGTKFGIITKVEATALTVFLNTDYAIADEAITSPFYSPMDIPFGFVKDPLKYQVEKTITAGSQATPTQNQWYNIESNSIDIPVGSWHTGYETVLYTEDASAVNVSAEITLSTANNSETAETTWTSQVALAGASGTLIQVAPVSRNYTLTLTTKDTYYLNARTTFSGISSINVGYQVAGGKIRAVCAYL